MGGAFSVPASRGSGSGTMLCRAVLCCAVLCCAVRSADAELAFEPC
jgi:hypothetical protein